MVLIPQKHLLGHYKPKFSNKTYELIDELDAYKIIQSDEYAKATKEIQNRFSKALKDKFKDTSKKPYQDAKQNAFESVTFSIKSSRAKGALIEHTNIICLDIDENTFEELEAFRASIHNGNIDFARACALSVSGIHNGSMWLNVWCDISEANYSEHKELFKLLRLSDKSNASSIALALHAAYADLLKYELSKFDIIAGASAKTLKQPRYLSHDADIYINLNAKKFTLDELLQFKKKTENKKRSIERNRVESKNYLNTSEWQSICNWFAETKLGLRPGAQPQTESNYIFEDNKRMYCFYFGCQANKLGIKKEQVLSHIEKVFIKHSKEFTEEYQEQVLSAYDSYPEENGKSEKLLHKIDEIELKLDEGERLNDKAQEIDKLLKEYGKLELIANCGIGKNYASVHGISTGYKKRHGEKTVIICSLNQKVKKDAKQYNLPYLTGERLNEAIEQGFNIWQEFDKSDVILCNQNQFPKLALYLKSQEQKCLAIVDEVQTISKAYKESTSKKLLSALNMSARETIIMTGTPKDYFQELGFKRVRVQSHHAAINLIVRCSEKNWLLNLGQLYKEHANTDTMLLVKYNHKKALSIAKDYLINHFNLEQEQVLIIHSDISKSDREVFEEKLNNDKVNSFDNHVKVVLCTSAINEGIDIYSERDITLVNFERTGFFAPDELVQFADRWRVKEKVKTLICYFPIIDHAPRGFNSFTPSYEFNEVFRLYNGLCDELNKSLNKSATYSLNALISLKNAFSDECKYIYFDEREQAYMPDAIACMIAIENKWLSKCTCVEGMEFITKNFSYFNLSFDTLDYEFSEIEQELVNEIQESEKINRKRAKELYLDLYQADKKLLFQAILRASADAEINQFIDKSIIHEHQAKELIKRLPELFSKYISIGKQLVKRDAKLKYYLLDEDERELIHFTNQSITSEQKFSEFYTGIKLHILLLLLDYCLAHPEKSIMTREQEREAQRLNKFINSYPMNEYYTQDEIVKIVGSNYRRNGKHFKVTKQNAMCLVKTFFELDNKRFGGQNKVHKYSAKSIKGMSEFLIGSGFKTPSKLMERIEENLSALI